MELRNGWSSPQHYGAKTVLSVEVIIFAMYKEKCSKALSLALQRPDHLDVQVQVAVDTVAQAQLLGGVEVAQGDGLVCEALAEAEVVVEVDLRLHAALLVLCLKELLDLVAQLLVQQRKRQRADGRHG